MRVDRERIQRYLVEILSNVRDIEDLFDQHEDKEILQNKHLMKSLKYSLVEVSEAISLVLQHILAKHLGVPVKGYIDTVRKASENRLISEELASSLKPFFDFRNSLVHRYWIIDDQMLLKNCKAGYSDFRKLIEELEKFLDKINEE
ncbi:MAG: HepT-like ribonuclease domain-containing protein [bacterium]